MTYQTVRQACIGSAFPHRRRQSPTGGFQRGRDAGLTEDLAHRKIARRPGPASPHITQVITITRAYGPG